MIPSHAIRSKRLLMMVGDDQAHDVTSNDAQPAKLLRKDHEDRPVRVDVTHRTVLGEQAYWNDHELEKPKPPQPNKKKRKKPKEKPKRPLSAYNIFFQNERRKLLDQRSAELRNLLQGGNVDTDACKSQAKMGFADLARYIASKWKTLDDTSKAYYAAEAGKEQNRYMDELVKWKVREAQQMSFSDDEHHHNVIGERKSVRPLGSFHPSTPSIRFHHDPHVLARETTTSNGAFVLGHQNVLSPSVRPVEGPSPTWIDHGDFQHQHQHCHNHHLDQESMISATATTRPPQSQQQQQQQHPPTSRRNSWNDFQTVPTTTSALPPPPPPPNLTRSEEENDNDPCHHHHKSSMATSTTNVLSASHRHHRRRSQDQETSYGSSSLDDWKEDSASMQQLTYDLDDEEQDFLISHFSLSSAPSEPSLQQQRAAP